jgi:hypothetical protein
MATSAVLVPAYASRPVIPTFFTFRLKTALHDVRHTASGVMVFILFDRVRFGGAGSIYPSFLVTLLTAYPGHYWLGALFSVTYFFSDLS